MTIKQMYNTIAEAHIHKSLGGKQYSTITKHLEKEATTENIKEFVEYLQSLTTKEKELTWAKDD